MNKGRWIEVDRAPLAAERILDAAGELFASQGVAATDMADIARAAGCSRATLYRYFENRNALHVAFVHRATRRVAATVPAGTDVVEATVEVLARVRDDPVLMAWFTDDGSGFAADVAVRSEVIEELAVAFLGGDDARLRARWLVRCIVSLLAMPAGRVEERAMLERFVAPVLAPPRRRVGRREGVHAQG